MRNIITLSPATALALLLVLNSGSATAQDAKKPAAKVDVTRPIPETVINRDAFTGNEIRVAAMNSVNADCTSGPLPTLRITTAPQGGELRQEEITIPVDRKEGAPRASCNGKPVQAVAIFYKSKSDFTGKDNIVIDVDFKTGIVRRFNYKIMVR